VSKLEDSGVEELIGLEESVLEEPEYEWSEEEEPELMLGLSL
jgi:hypothetical protein